MAIDLWRTRPCLDDNSLTVTVQDDTLSVEGELKFQPPPAP
jgi:hypothetical protein